MATRVIRWMNKAADAWMFNARAYQRIKQCGPARAVLGTAPWPFIVGIGAWIIFLLIFVI